MKRFLWTLTALTMAFSMAACGSTAAVPSGTSESVEASAESTQEKEPAAESSVEEKGFEEAKEESKAEESKDAAEVTQNPEKYEVSYPVTVKDQAGREIVIEKQPETLVSGYYISSSLLIALQLDDKMVGIEAKAGKRPIYKLAAKELIDLPSVGSAKEFDLEGCAALQADLVILPLKLKEAAATLEELGIQTILVNPESEKLLIEMIDVISTATNTVERAEELKGFINAQKDMLSGKVNGAASPKVYLAGNSDVLSTAGNKMYQCSMIELAGGENVAAGIEDKYWVNVDYEQILAWDPEYIIIAAEAEYTAEDVLADEVLAECSAVKNGNVYKIPSDAEAWDSPVPSGILGSVWLSCILHPDVVSLEESNQIIGDFYETFYGFTYGKNE